MIIILLIISSCVHVFRHNILIDSNNNGVVGDFGFALELPQTVSGRTLVTAPLIARTEGYFAPEITTGKLSPLSDVYSCGIVSLLRICVMCKLASYRRII